MAEPVRKSRRILAVLSPNSLNEHWDSATVYEAVKQLSSFGPKLICVALKELPTSGKETKNSQGETLSSLLRQICVIPWDRLDCDRMWLSLRLELPPKRFNRTATTENIRFEQGDNTRRLTSESQNSLDALV